MAQVWRCLHPYEKLRIPGSYLQPDPAEVTKLDDLKTSEILLTVLDPRSLKSLYGYGHDPSEDIQDVVSITHLSASGNFRHSLECGTLP